MKINKQRNMLTDPVFSLIVSVAFPLMLNNLIRTLYNLIDGLYLSRLSAQSFAATAFIEPLHATFLSVGQGIGIAGTVLIAQTLGANQKKKAQQYVTQSLLTCLCIGSVATVFGFILTPNMLQVMGAKEEFLTLSTTYLQINFIGLLFDFIYFVYQAILTAKGHTTFITLSSVIALLINTILDPLFIFDTLPFGLRGLNLGITGAGLATITAKLCLMLFVLFVVHKEQSIVPSKPLKMNWSLQKDIYKVGMPAAFGVGAASLGFTIINGLIQSYGTETLTAYALVNRLTGLLTQPQLGIGGALPAIVGQNIGAKQYERVKDIMKKATILVLTISSMGSIVFLVFRQPVLSVFLSQSGSALLWEQVFEYANYSAFIIFFMGLFSVLNGFFQGVKKTNYAMYMTIGRLWGIRLPCIWLLSQLTQLGATSVWIAMLLSNALTVLFGYYLYYRLDIEKI